MSIRVIGILLSFAAMSVGGVASSVYWMRMTDEVNRSRRRDDQFSVFGSDALKNQRIYDAYRSEHPEGRLHLRVAASVGLSLLGLTSLAASAMAFR